MLAFAHHALLAAVACALGAAGLRVAEAAGAQGAERGLAAAVVAGVVVVTSTLALGVAGLAGQWWAHALVAVAVLAAAQVALPPTGPPRLRPWWAARGRAERAAWGAGAGALGLVTAWQVARPWLGSDGVTYHLAIPLAWVASGDAGARVDTVVGYPVGSYPLTFEVVTTWVLALTRGLVVAPVLTPLALALGAVALWAALGRLGVVGPLRAGAVAAAATLPGGLAYLGQPGTDLSAWAWACCALALALGAAGVRGGAPRPALAGLAVAAAGLSLGIKTTSALPLALLLGWLVLRLRRGRAEAPGAAARPLALGAVAAVAVAGLWPLRNLLDHGSPLWPFVPAPWGDPAPPAMAAVDGRFAAAPAAALQDGGLELYAALAGGGPLLVLGAVALAATVRTRAALALAGAGLLGVLAWSVAPYTGTPGIPAFGALSVRYLLPAFTVCALAVAVAGARGGAGVRKAALVVLALAVVVSLDRLARHYDPPHVPPAWVPAAGALLGAVALAALASLPPAPVALATAAAALALGVAAPGFVERHARTGGLTAGVVAAAVASPAFADGDAPVAAGPQSLAPLAGDRLQHEVRFVTDRTPCRVLRDVATRGVLAVRLDVAPAAARPMVACLAGLAPRFDDGRYALWARG